MRHETSALLLLALSACSSPARERPPTESQNAATSQPATAANAATPAAQATAATPTPPAQPAGLPAPADVAAAPADAQRTASGLASKVLTPGTGTEHPRSNSVVTVDYTGWTTDGQMFDSSVVRGQRATFPLDRVIPGWTEGLQLMVKGEKRRFWIPVELAYNNMPGRPAGMLVFDVELFDYTVPPPPPPVPTDVAAPPRNAECNAQNLCSRVLTAGRGGPKPSANAVVTVHYSGWTTDGRMFDSSVSRGEPAQFPLQRVVPGFSQAIQLMAVGETRRIWIPQDLAYQGRPGAPAGTLVFDVQLISIDQP